MKRSLFISLIFILFQANAYTQRVETLVTGLSTFDDGLAVDSSGYIYASRYYGNSITRISPDGETEIFSSGFSSPNAIAFDNDGNLIVPNATGNRVHRVSKDGTKEIIVSNIENPTGIAVDKSGNIYISQYSLSRISKLDSTGNVSTFLSGGLLNGPVTMMFDEEGELYIGNFNDGKILRYSADSTLSAIGDIPGWLGSFTLSDSTIYATAFQQHQIYKINKNGEGQSVFAGSGTKGSKDGDLESARFNAPNGIALSNSGDTLYISDFVSRSLRMITGLIPNNPKIEVSDTLDFGVVNIDTNQVVEKKLSIWNTGNDTLRIRELDFDDTQFQTDVDSLEIPPYSSAGLTISFLPDGPGAVSSKLEIHSNAGEVVSSVILVGEVYSNTSIENRGSRPKEIELHQNYPNPFNPSTQILINLPLASQIILEVYDIKGRKVATLYNGQASSGNHSFGFNASGLSSGIYYCRLVSSGRTEIITMALIK